MNIWTAILLIFYNTIKKYIYNLKKLLKNQPNTETKLVFDIQKAGSYC